MTLKNKTAASMLEKGKTQVLRWAQNALKESLTIYPLFRVW